MHETVQIRPDNPLVRRDFVLQEETGGSQEEFIYLTHEQLEDFLNRTTQQFPDKTELYQIGQSVEGKNKNENRKNIHKLSFTRTAPAIWKIATVQHFSLLPL